MSMGLTPRQAECLQIIRDRMKASGVSPTMQEISEHLGLNSKSGAHRILDALEQRGLIRRLKGKARAIELLDGDAGEYTIRPLPEVRRGIQAYAASQNITEKAAIEEACRVYFVEAAAQ